jgi:hypothetical protein
MADPSIFYKQMKTSTETNSAVLPGAEAQEACKIRGAVAIPIQIASLMSWIGASYLMVYQYRKRQSEEWYAQKMFWYCNLII